MMIALWLTPTAARYFALAPFASRLAYPKKGLSRLCKATIRGFPRHCDLTRLVPSFASSKLHVEILSVSTRYLKVGRSFPTPLSAGSSLHQTWGMHGDTSPLDRP